MGRVSIGRGTSKDSSQKVAIAALVVGGLGLLSLSVLPITGSASPAPTTITVSKNATWGPTLTLKNGDALYRLSADSKDHSRCTGQCAVFWPPVLLAAGQKVAVGKGVSGLGSFTRSNGARQVTLDGLPLYRFVGDKKPGQVTGNVKNVFGHWYSINPQHPTVAPTKVKTGGTGGSGTTTTSPPTTTTSPPTTTTPPPTTTTTTGGGIAY
jgi:predicted lipoprotein with Yx(FWY)xxD motif